MPQVNYMLSPWLIMKPLGIQLDFEGKGREGIVLGD